MAMAHSRVGIAMPAPRAASAMVLRLALSCVCMATAAAAASAPPPPCPPACAWDPHRKCCGVYDGIDGTCSCPAAVLFSVGQDSDMVLQRAPAKAAVYGSVLALGAGAKVEVTVSGAAALGGRGHAPQYTVQAEVLPSPTYHAPGGANYSASGKLGSII